jgi:AcrR family transcriptional regulator
LEGLSIGRLATELAMSKSGVLGQFGSKEELQLETVRLVLANFRVRVWEPIQHLERGLPRLLGICEAWARYEVDPGYPGGCCVATFSHEFDGRPGRVREELARGVRQWRSTLVREITVAIEAGVTAAQLRAVIGRLITAGHWTPGDPDILIVADAGYDGPRLAWLLRDLPAQFLTRMRSDRVLRRPAPARPPGTSGRPRRHGDEFVFGDPGTWGNPDVTTHTGTRLYGPALARAWTGCIPG